MRVLAYKPHQLNDSTYSGVGSMTWSIVEQGIGIVCACLPTLRPLFQYVNPHSNKDKSRNSSSIGMDNLRSGTVRSDIATGAKSPWQPACDSESTVGFARLQDDEVAMSPADIQRSVYAPIGVAVSTPGGKNQRSTRIIPTGILKEQTIDQRSEMIR